MSGPIFNPAIAAGAQKHSGPYAASAIRFEQQEDMTYAFLRATSPTMSVSSFVCGYFWIKYSILDGNVDPLYTNDNRSLFVTTNWNVTSDSYILANNSSNTAGISLITPSDTVVVDVWLQYIFALDVTNASGSRRVFLQVNDAVASEIGFDTGSGFNIDWGSVGFTINQTATSLISYSDMWVTTKRYIDWTNPSNLAKIRHDGKAVSPSSATAAFGAPDILFSGNHTSFPNNQGTAGPFILTGTITDAAGPT